MVCLVDMQIVEDEIKRWASNAAQITKAMEVYLEAVRGAEARRFGQRWVCPNPIVSLGVVRGLGGVFLVWDYGHRHAGCLVMADGTVGWYRREEDGYYLPATGESPDHLLWVYASRALTALDWIAHVGKRDQVPANFIELIQPLYSKADAFLFEKTGQNMPVPAVLYMESPLGSGNKRRLIVSWKNEERLLWMSLSSGDVLEIGSRVSRSHTRTFPAYITVPDTLMGPAMLWCLTGKIDPSLYSASHIPERPEFSAFWYDQMPPQARPPEDEEMCDYNNQQGVVRYSKRLDSFVVDAKTYPAKGDIGELWVKYPHSTYWSSEAWARLQQR